MRFFLPLSVLTLWLTQSNDAFHLPATSSTLNRNIFTAKTTDATRSALFASQSNSSNENMKSPAGQKRRRLVSKMKKSLAFLAPVAIVGSSVGAALVANPETANAGAPVMAIPKAKPNDPVQKAFDRQEIQDMAAAQQELSAFQAKARSIEKESGPAARDAFEKEFKESQRRKAEENQEGLEQLKRDLLDQGIDPDLDIEGTRQITLYTRGVDLGDVNGTPHNVEKRYLEQGSSEAFAVQKKAHREMIKAMVQDLKNRGKDPLVFFRINREKTDMIMNLPTEKAEELAAKYNKNLELYGQIAVPKEGEKSAKELMAESGKTTQGSDISKDEQKRLKAEAKAKVAAEKAAAKAAAKAEKERVKAEKLAAKEAAKAEKEVAKEAAKAEKEAAKAAATAAVSAASTPVDDVEIAPESEIDGDSVADQGDSTEVVVADVSEETKSVVKSNIVKASAVVVTVGGGAYALKMVRDKAAADEEERQRQFRMLMGESAVDESNDDGLSDETLSDTMFVDENEVEVGQKPSEPVVEAGKKKKKKRRGLKSVFNNKKNSRETNIDNLVAPGVKAAEFSKTLAKILTFGAPGRFPDVTNLPGPMPLEAFDLDAASSILAETQTTAGVTKEESAEIFANVVNCMLIDIVDLASTSLKENDQKVTSDAIGIVITFMDLAASLYGSIADGVVIAPVTYGGDISRSKLEQMFTTYAMSGMSDFASMDDKFDKRVSLLQDVFQINAKKAEGLMMKAMQKSMMEMMKGGEMPAGMEDMMKGMGDMGGMGVPGMGDGEEPDPEQLKEMLRALKDLKDSGALPESELAEVRKQFKEAFGSSIDDVMRGAGEAGDELGAQDQELLDLMKDILE
mmetsp:Transcript_27948/g.75972  ORF Transcript_27948/g.75972 Transcript_27948/m.75972 type:complete len:853 (+) Transcript_27948:103-2661(+)|eukprot:CAMPEP_0172372842 /NCGR_PEP_ID=MMETSP1060-20121228/49349_1 /TAXON_ID=37318 /ORGANISM="Pseudo-nitzschia pungens, Strain cf. cingulata" /LENGTH=852 /DNA_ID=CAMNT_0013098977 /DNA_START=80 /DNA_END=2638 /DNA_ORIENTATION=+